MIGALAAHLWQSTLFALAAGILTLAFRKNRAHVRYWLWLSASLKFFVPFSWLIGLGGRLGWAPAAQRIAMPQVSLAMERITVPFADPLPLMPRAPSHAHWTGLAILAVWLCGVAAIGLIRLRLWLRVRAAVRAGTPLNIPAAVEIRSSPALLEPGVVGLLRPVLLLPEGILDRLTPSQLEAILAHELCHVRRRDNLFSALHMLVEAGFWFHPLVWWIGARLLEERERACDERVLILGNRPRDYADAILNVCKLYVESPLACVSGVTGANLKRRIEAILTNRTGHGLTRARKVLLAGAGIAALAGPVATGVLIGVGHAPLVHAQSPVTAAPRQAAPAAASSGQDAPPAAQAGGELLYKNRRLIAIFFDFDTMTSDDQSRAQQAAIDYIHRRLPADLVAVLSTENGAVRVVQDFTDDQAVLESSIRKLESAGGASASTANLQLSRLETAVRLLGVLPQKKVLMYFASGAVKTGNSAAVQDPALQETIDAAVRANVAFYPVDVRGPAQSALADVAPDISDRLRPTPQTAAITAQMHRISTRHGQPDQVEDRGSNGQIWRYNYLDNFHSNVEFEFLSGDRGADGVRINWPPPVATFIGVPAADTALARRLAKPGQPASAVIAGFPGRHASMATYPADEIQTLTIPLDGLTGRVDISGEVKMVPAPGGGAGGGFVRDNVEVSAEAYQANFLLPAGSYVCTVAVKEQATGQVYTETINFQVK